MFQRKLRVKRVIFCLLCLGLVVLVLYYFSNKEKYIKGYANKIKQGVLYNISKIIDGDTVVANISGSDTLIRLIGIDTPETVDPRKPSQCYGKQASDKAKEILMNKNVYLEKEVSKGDYDKYGRVLAHIRLIDDSLYGQYMIENGYAKEYTFNNEPYKYQKEFKSAQKTAKKEKRGLWGMCK